MYVCLHFHKISREGKTHLGVLPGKGLGMGQRQDLTARTFMSLRIKKKKKGLTGAEEGAPRRE